MNSTVYQNMIEQALLQVHTAFCGKVIAINGDLASIQPLNMVKPIGGQAKPQAVVEHCPVLKNARKFIQKQVKTSSGGDPAHSHTVTVWEPVLPAAGDIVYCVCADRDISETRTGAMATPVQGHHMISSAVVAGIL